MSQMLLSVQGGPKNGTKLMTP